MSFEDSVWRHEVEVEKGEQAGERTPGPPRGSGEFWRHPVRWVRWRVDSARKGPYALDFDEWQRSQGRG